MEKALSLDFRQKASSVFLVLSGPGGTGKTSLIRRWLRDCTDLGYVPNVTTRKPRPASVGEDGFYQFVSRSEFQRMVEENMFAQWVNPSEGKYYGTPIAPLRAAIAEGRDLVFDYTPQLYLNLRRQFRQQVVGIFIVPPTFSELLSRLERRGTEQGIDLHIKQQMALQDLGYVDEHHYHVVNDDLDVTLQTLKSIHVAERCSMRRIEGLDDACRKASPLSMMFYYDPLATRLSGMNAA
ncbi:MAG: hypothetical protein JSS26_14850 [Nitrospira sp.]|nr:hypothetical protein [Nitrospira sp.]